MFLFNGAQYYVSMLSSNTVPVERIVEYDLTVARPWDIGSYN